MTAPDSPAQHEGPEYDGPLTVKVYRPDTGELIREVTVRDDYFLVCQGRRFVKSWQQWGRTVQVNIAWDDGKGPVK